MGYYTPTNSTQATNYGSWGREDARSQLARSNDGYDSGYGDSSSHAPPPKLPPKADGGNGGYGKRPKAHPDKGHEEHTPDLSKRTMEIANVGAAASLEYVAPSVLHPS